MSSTPYNPAAPQPKGWFARNWLWFLPVGCLVLVLGFVAFIGAILAIAFGAMKMSDPYQQALERAQAHPEVVAELGEPITVGWFLSGNINVNGPSGEANLAIPVSGPLGSGTIYVEGEKRAGQWHYDVLEVEVDGRADRIPLLDAEVVGIRPPDTERSRTMRLISGTSPENPATPMSARGRC